MLNDWLTEVLYYDIWQTADEITMHDRYSLSNKINYSLQSTMNGVSMNLCTAA